MKDLLKKIGGAVGAEEAVEAVANEADKASPGLGRKLLITIVAACIGAMTTWGLTIDQRVYSLTQDIGLRQTIQNSQDQVRDLETRIERRMVEILRLIHRLEAKLEEKPK